MIWVNGYWYCANCYVRSVTGLLSYGNWLGWLIALAGGNRVLR